MKLYSCYVYPLTLKVDIQSRSIVHLFCSYAALLWSAGGSSTNKKPIISSHLSPKPPADRPTSFPVVSPRVHPSYIVSSQVTRRRIGRQIRVPAIRRFLSLLLFSLPANSSVIIGYTPAGFI